ncbi:alpha/beta fold hydrolase [Propylenella binzhouense]|uniref:Alpha/beta fold hydrolase n=1 Tax=Propylenella binzhouense TaxID=2555902 RepID=A0A964T387_9HYPH|nr:alpha/beta hydrolase [Propylenella binzhouense]MYZ47681.1 alpha/beta fold hydrolase [Propylenella binzhouense]
MPDIDVRPGIRLHYEDDWFGAPWEKPEPIVLVHGIAESGRAWTQWVPLLSGTFRVIRPDMPGFGRSPVPETYSWRSDEIAGDLLRLLDLIGVGRFHLAGAKYGGSVAMQIAIAAGDRVRSLSLLGAPHTGDGTRGAMGRGRNPEMIAAHGVRYWAAETQASRLGPEASAAQVAWWTDELMGPTDPRPCIEASSQRAAMDLSGDLHRITAPTLVITTEESGLQSVEKARGYQELIPNSRLLVLPGAAYHIAAVRPEVCAAEVRAFAVAAG